MWISDNFGGVTHLDLRERVSKTRRYELSNSKIGTISVNPTRTHFLLTASNSRFIKYVRYKQGFMCCSLSLLQDLGRTEAQAAPYLIRQVGGG